MDNPIRIAFVGFRHGHILSLYTLLQQRQDIAITAACEEDPVTREGLVEKGVKITHASYDAMLAEAPSDVIACGDAFGLRGARAIQALESGRHVLSDKPLCTRLDELVRIADLVRKHNLRVGCMLDLVDSAPIQTVRRLVREGAVGEVHLINFTGQHPLRFGTRPGWYFQEDMHGGTLNDIAIHAIDAIPWMSGLPIVEATAARVWNARLTQYPAFQDGALLMLRLANGAGVLGDVSYLSPDGQGYSMPNYWRFTVTGADGSLETANGASSVIVARRDETNPREVPLGPARPGGYLEDFLLDMAQTPNRDGLRTERVLYSSRQALLVQQAADSQRFPVPLV